MALGRARGTRHAHRPCLARGAERDRPWPRRPRSPPLPAEHGRRRQPWDVELVRRARPDTRLGKARVSRPRRGRGVRTALGAIAHVCRLDEDDPEAAWYERARTLEGVAARASERRFDAIRLHGPGTDLTVGLFPSSVWHAADFKTVDGLRHFPNIPSEEMFTTPDPSRVDGHVTATRPLEVYGALVEGIRVEFADGKVTAIDADRGADTLRSVAAKDEGASSLESSRSSTGRAASAPSARPSSRPCSTRMPRATSRWVAATTSRSQLTRIARGSTGATSTSTS